MIEVLYEDRDILVVDKQSGMAVHPSPGHESGTMTEELVRRYPAMRGVGSRERPGVVHRLDVETSGVMVFALSQTAYLGLRKAFESHAGIEKTYLAVLHGAPKERRGTLTTGIVSGSGGRRMKVVEAGARGPLAVTHWQTLGRQGSLALVEFVIETGRTHQIRVHAAHLGHPIVGDPLYGDAAKDRRFRPGRLLLHAVRLVFDHPVTGRRMAFGSEPPSELVYAGASSR